MSMFVHEISRQRSLSPVMFCLSFKSHGIHVYCDFITCAATNKGNFPAPAIDIQGITLLLLLTRLQVRILVWNIVLREHNYLECLIETPSMRWAFPGERSLQALDHYEK